MKAGVQRESNVDKIMKLIERNNKVLFDNIAETESVLTKSIDDVIKANTKKITDCFNREVEKIKKNEEENLEEIQALEEKMKAESSKNRARFEFVSNQVAKGKKLSDLFKFNIESSSYMNTQNICYLNNIKNSKDYEYSMKLSELIRKESILQEVIEKYKMFTQCNIEKIDGDTMRVEIRGVNPRNPEDFGYVHITYFKESYIGRKVITQSLICRPGFQTSTRSSSF